MRRHSSSTARGRRLLAAGLLAVAMAAAISAARPAGAQLPAAGDSTAARIEERRRLARDHRAILEAAAPIDARLAELRRTALVEVEDFDKAIPLNELDAVIAAERDSLARRMLESARSGVWSHRLDPWLVRRTEVVDSLCTALGYGSYAGFSTAWRQLEAAPFLAETFRLIRSTDAMYRALLAELSGATPVRAATGRLLVRARDFAPMLGTTEFDRWFTRPAGPRLEALLAQLALVPAAGPGAPLGSGGAAGAAGWIDTFRSGGEAAHRAALLAGGASPEEVGLAPELFSAATGELLAALVTTPAWLQHERAAAGESASPDHPGDLGIAQIVRWRLFCELHRIRVECGAGLLFEAAVHADSAELAAPYLVLPAGSGPRETYRQLLTFALGAPVSDDDVHDFRTVGQDFMAPADRLRAMALGAAAAGRLASELGPEWFNRPEAGERLRADLLSLGAGRTPDEAARAWGEEALSLRPLQQRYEELYDWSEAILERGRR